MKTVFLRILEADDKAAALLAAIDQAESSCAKDRFEVHTASFAAVPGSPFAYWVSERLRQLFSELPPFEAKGRFVLGGLKTLSDERFVRAWWEVSVADRASWPGLAKGGAFSPFYADVFLRVNWRTQGDEISWYGYQRRPREGFGAASRGVEAYFRPGLTWPRRTNGLSLRVMPTGCIFADKGPAAFVVTDDSQELLALAAVTNSRAFSALVSLQLARTELAQSYEVGLIQSTPVPNLNKSDREVLATLGRAAWSLRRALDTRTEASHAFVLPALLQVSGDTLSDRAIACADEVRRIESELSGIQEEIDDRCFDLYGIAGADRSAITEGFVSNITDANDEPDSDLEGDAERDEEQAELTASDASRLVSDLVSWAVGVAFGRFDVRLAIGDRSLQVEPEPFDPLPACSPAMLTGVDGLPLASAPAGYPHAFPENGILVDDSGHPRDLTAAVRAVFDTVFGTTADACWNEVAALLDPKDHDLGAWIASSFFEHHLKRHSKSRRKAPILWQLGTPSGRYSVWLCLHSLTRDSFFQLQNDVVAPKLAHEERQLTSLVQSAGDSPSAKERKEIAARAASVEELRTLLDEVKRVTPLWNPTLDDSVALAMAPLWRLVPRHKPWQKELKGKWDELVAAKYDWAHIAMHLWPERVLPKCATDRSLAIAHGVEDIFWVEGADGKWKPRPTPTLALEDLVRERSSPAVKAALKSLLDAPVAGRISTRTQKVKTDA